MSNVHLHCCMRSRLIKGWVRWSRRKLERLLFQKPRPISGEFAATVIIPLLNQADDWLKHSVESALNQSIPCQVLVITSPQTSNSNLRILDQLQRNTNLEVHQQWRPGFPAALNTGIAISNTRRIGFLLSDDWLEPNAVEVCMRYSTDIVCGGIRTYAADGIHELRRFRKRLTLAEFDRQPTLEQKAKYLQHFLLFQKHKLE